MNSADRIAAEDTLTPIRPGKIGERPFWNTYARQFIYAPAFEFSPVSGASGYRFHVRDRFGTDHAFSADSPDAPLSPMSRLKFVTTASFSTTTTPRLAAALSPM